MALFHFLKSCQNVDSFGVLIATMATIIASQALISGTFTLVNEAMKLKLMAQHARALSKSVKRTNLYYLPLIGY
jgi:KUP system potassium uptake protein